MSSAAKPVRRNRHLLEQFQVGTGARTGGAALKIDRDLGVIYGVKVLGRYSRNNHGLKEAENGTEYSPACMRAALPMYENAKVKINHPPDRSKPGQERDADDTFGVLRNVRIESDDDGVRADLYYRKHHTMTADVLDDVERKLGLWGLSHNASASRERIDRANRRLVIEELGQVRSVDLVDKPATTRNLWESDRAMPKTTTLRELLESRKATLTPVRAKWAAVVLEDDMTAPADAPMEAEEGGSEEDALWAGFVQACNEILHGDGTAKDKGKKITEYLTAHEKLTQAGEPEEPVEESEECGPDGKPKKKDDDKMESEEVKALRAEKKARELCESLGYVPTSLQVEAVAGIRDPKRQRELAESYKPADGKKTAGFKVPRAAAPGAIKPGAKPNDKPRDTPESEVVPAARGMRILMGG